MATATNMKIAILTLGTRGDVQPYAVLGQALKHRGYQVTLSTAKNFEEFVKSYDIDFIPVEADFQELLNSEEGKKMMKGNPFAVKRNLNTWVYPLITNSLKEFYKIAKESDLILYHVKTLADCFADQFPHKMIRANVLPIIEPTNEFVNPALSGLPIPSVFNKLTYKFSNFSFKLLSKPIRQFRRNAELSSQFNIPMVKNIFGLSPYFLSVPKDFPTNSNFTGFWFGNSTTELTEDLKDFIKAGKPPLLLTFGSMPFNSKFDLQTAIIKLTEQYETRLIIIKGWGLDQTKRLENNTSIKVIQSAPYDKLFPLTKAIIHHGGIGTTAECLRAGIPFLICPILYPIGDQMFWGKQAFKKGVAVKPIPMSKMTEKTFLTSIKELLTNKDLYDNAKRIHHLIIHENGLKNTIKEIEKTIDANMLL